jgi:hypothetical protein
VVPASELARQDHGRFAVVVLADVGRLGDSAESWLERHVDDGGGLLLVLGNRTDIRFWNARFMPEIVGAEIVAPIERASGVRLAPASQGHPMLDGLVFGERLIDDIVARRAFGVRAEGAEVVLELPGLGPALFVARGGTQTGAAGASGGGADPGSTPRPGEVAVLSIGVDPTWSDLPRSGFMVPLTHRLVERLARRSGGTATATVGSDLVAPLPEPPSGRVDVETPDGRTLAAELRGGGAPAAVVRATSVPGVYRFTASGRIVALGAVNVDPAESDLRQLDRDSVEERLSGIAVAFVDPSRSVSDDVLQSRYGRELWRVMLYAALALIALEMLIARSRFAAGPAGE